MLQLICKWIHFFQTDILWIVRSSNASGHLSGVHTGSWGIIRASNPRPMLQMLSVLVRVNLAWELEWERLKKRLSSSKSGWDKGSSMYRVLCIYKSHFFSVSLCVYVYHPLLSVRVLKSLFQTIVSPRYVCALKGHFHASCLPVRSHQRSTWEALGVPLVSPSAPLLALLWPLGKMSPKAKCNPNPSSFAPCHSGSLCTTLV